MVRSTTPWLLVVARLPSLPSRHRVAVWRELRRAGALALGGGTWAMPAGPTANAAVDQVRELVRRAEGELLVLDAGPTDDETRVRLENGYTAAIEAEWVELLSECDKYGAELRHEIEIQKFTLAELEEEEQSLDRLRRWHRALSLRDRFGAPSGAEAERRVAQCTTHLEAYSELVYQALGQ
ncbi:MAG: Chromate resistance protein ChrB [Aquihabitans sp.]